MLLFVRWTTCEKQHKLVLEQRLLECFLHPIKKNSRAKK